MQVLYILAAPAPKPDTSDFGLPGWLTATIVLVALALIFGAIFRTLQKRGHTGWGLLLGVIALLTFTGAAAVLAEQRIVSYVVNLGKDVGTNVATDARSEGVPVTVAGFFLALAVLLAVYYLFGKNNQGSGIALGLFFGFSLLIASPHFEWVRWLLRADYRLLEIIWPF